MKILKYFLFSLFVLVFVLSPCFAKKKIMDEENPSVILLKELSHQGKELRKNDISLEKADTSNDISRVREIKKNYYEKHGYEKK